MKSRRGEYINDLLKLRDKREAETSRLRRGGTQREGTRHVEDISVKEVLKTLNKKVGNPML